MSKTAILVDGGFYRVRHCLRGEHSPQEAADALFAYCCRHLHERSVEHELYRIFYYDCPPIEKHIYHPLLKKTIDFSKTEDHDWMTEFLSALKQKRKVALRLGKLDNTNTQYTLKYEAVKKLCAGAISPQDLTTKDFTLTMKQKGVDMKIGIDIASLAYKKQVDQIVLIAGDSDFVPAAKVARREGIDFVLDTLGNSISADNDLTEHIDGMRSCGDPYASKRT